MTIFKSAVFSILLVISFASCKPGPEKRETLRSREKAGHKLNNIWILEELEGVKINEKDFGTELPNIDTDAAELKFAGFAGCNRIGGKLFLEKKLLRFIDISTTEMMCPNYSQERKLVLVLQNATHYEIKNNRLYLFNPQEAKAIFRKFD